MIVDTTWLSYIFAVVVGYFIFLLVIVLLSSRKQQGMNTSNYSPFFVIVIPARNEEPVIEATIENLLRLEKKEFLILIMNDGSADETSTIAKRFKQTGKVLVVDRDSAIAGRGKGDVLNHAYRLVCEEFNRQGGRQTSLRVKLPRKMGPQDIIICVMDADGRLEPGCLAAVSPYFENPSVGAVQLPVRIWNYGDGWLTRMQDIEFVGFSYFMQSARNWLGSVGLGGNGQFARFTALKSLGNSPWSDCLTEDLDIGLRLLAKGWKIRFCRSTFVAQHGLGELKAIMRQRTRWIQGHYTCWMHLLSLWRTGNLRIRTRIDSTIYLSFVAFILLVGLNIFLSLLGLLGLIVVENNFFSFTENLTIYLILSLLFAFGPTCLFLITYFRASERRFSIWTFPGLVISFAIYAYLFIPANLQALWNIVVGKAVWTKTPKNPVSECIRS